MYLNMFVKIQQKLSLVQLFMEQLRMVYFLVDSSFYIKQFVIIIGSGDIIQI